MYGHQLKRVVVSKGNAGNDTSTGNSGASPLGWNNVIPLITALLASVGGLASVIYLLGLFSLWVPLQRNYTQDFVAAWHATSLVPRTVVVGLGFQHLVAVPLLIIGVLFAIAYIAQKVFLTPLHAKRHRIVPLLHQIPLDTIDKRNKFANWLQDHESQIIVGVLVAVDSFFAWGVIGSYLGWRINASLPTFLQVPLWGMGMISTLTSVLLYAVVSGLAISKVSHNSGNKEEMTDEVTLRRYSTRYLKLTLVGVPFYLALIILLTYYSHFSDIGTKTPLQLGQAVGADGLLDIGLIVIAGVSMLTVNAHISWELFADEEYRKRLLTHRFVIGVVWAFIAAFTFAFINQAPLPKVVVNGSPSVEGRLLAHADGFWYVYNDAGDLIAIRDDKVTTVKVPAPSGRD
jgi:hypothetical protein